MGRHKNTAQHDKNYWEKIKTQRPDRLAKVRRNKREWRHAWKSNNPEKYREAMLKGQQRRNEYSRKYRQDRKASVRASRIMREYGITSEQYEALLVEQGGVCFICRRPERRVLRGNITYLEIDHNHQTGQVRKLLCHACNVSVGFLDENPDRMRRMAEYIESFLPQRVLDRDGGEQ